MSSSICACFPCVCMCVCMLGCTTVPVAPYHMLSSVGMQSPLDDVILQWPTPLQGCGNQLDPTDYPQDGDAVSSIYLWYVFMNLFFHYLFWSSHGCFPWTVGRRGETMQLLVRTWPECDLALISLYPGKRHAHTYLIPSTYWKHLATENDVPHAALSVIT